MVNLKSDVVSSVIDNRRGFLKKATLGSLGLGLANNDFASASNNLSGKFPINKEIEKSSSKIVITDLRCGLIGGCPVVRIVTNTGLSGYAQDGGSKNYLKPYVLFYRDYLIGMDPTDVERVLLKIRRLGSFKPWGAAVSIIEMALWDVAGKIAGVPVYKLLGGKVRDNVRCYGRTRLNPAGRGEIAQAIKASKEGFSIIKIGTAFHSSMPQDIPDFFYGEMQVGESPAKKMNVNSNDNNLKSKVAPHPNRGPLTEKGLKAIINNVEKWKIALGDEIGLAFDLGPGFMLSDAIRLAKVLEPYNLMWLEDLLTGDYTPYVMADLYRELTQSTSTPIHTGEQIYLRQNFRELIEKNSVRVIGPDPSDMGGISELKWVAEYADLHGIQMAPHGIGVGLFGFAAQVQVGATMPDNYIAFEYPSVLLFNENAKWWLDIVEGLPESFIKDGLIKVWDRPGIGIDFIVKEAKKYLKDEDKNFFD